MKFNLLLGFAFMSLIATCTGTAPMSDNVVNPTQTEIKQP